MYEHLYNLELKILSFEKSRNQSNAHLLLTTDVIIKGGSETYDKEDNGIGDRITFMTVNIPPNVQQVGECRRIDIESSIFDPRSAVNEVIQWIHTTLKSLQ